jgi:hypothetical protein
MALQGKQPEKSAPTLSAVSAEVRTAAPVLSVADALAPLGSPLDHVAESPQKAMTPIAAPPFSLADAFGSPQGTVMSPQTPAAPQSPPAHPPPVPYVPPVGLMESPSYLSSATNLNLTPSIAGTSLSTASTMPLSGASCRSSLEEVESGAPDTPTSTGDSEASEEWGAEAPEDNQASKSARPDGGNVEVVARASGAAVKGRMADAAPTPSRALRVSTPAR